MIRLRRLADQIATVGSDGPLPFVALEHLDGGTGGFATDAVIEDKEAGTAGMVQFLSGDVLFGKLRPYLRKSWLADRSGLCSSELIVMRPRAGKADSRWLAYAVQAQPFVDWAVASSEGVKMPRTSWEKLGLYELDPPPVGGQRAIADYLDAETVRIDQLIEKRLRSVALLDHRADVLTSVALDNPVWPRVPLKWVTRSTVGIVIRPSELYVDAGVPCVRGFNVSRGMVSADDIVYISAEANEANAKSKLRAGDVVVVRTGNAGAAAVVPGWLDGGNCVDLLIVRSTVTLLPRFLEIVLNSEVVRRQIEQQSVGALQAHFNTESLASLRIPVPDMRTQGAVVSTLDSKLEEVGRLQSLHRRNVDLLQERRQALITAAVVGEIEIPGVAA